MHAYLPTDWERRRVRRYKRALLEGKHLPVPNDPVIGRRAVAFLCLLALGIAAVGVAARWL